MHQFMLWLSPAVEKFPQRQRFLLGDRIQTAGLDILEGLIEATYSRSGCLRLLETVNVRLEKLRISSPQSHEEWGVYLWPPGALCDFVVIFLLSTPMRLARFYPNDIPDQRELGRGAHHRNLPTEPRASRAAEMRPPAPVSRVP